MAKTTKGFKKVICNSKLREVIMTTIDEAAVMDDKAKTKFSDDFEKFCENVK